MTIPGWLATELETVPEYDAFAGVDALVRGLHDIAERHPDLTTLRTVGTSRAGEAIVCLTVDDGTPADDALVIGLPHPNEPIGGLTALHLAARVAGDADLRRRLGHRWHVVACVDPDGLRLNEGWLAGPFVRSHYARHFYRPAGVDQVEWTFPVAVGDVRWDTPIPETAAVMRLIDEHTPALIASLHNSELGGAYYYLSRAEPALHPVLRAVPGIVGIPLHLGEPESAITHAFDEAVFESPDAETFHARLVAAGVPWPPHGGSTSMYAAEHGSLVLLSELPYWRDPSASDTSGSGTSYADGLAALGQGLNDLGAVLAAAADACEGHLRDGTAPLWKAGAAFGRHMSSFGDRALERAADPANHREATVAEAASLVNNLHAFRLRFGGMLTRALADEVAAGNEHPHLREHATALAAAYETWVAEDAEAVAHEPIPIHDLVTVQYAATIAAAAHLHQAL